MWILEYSLLTRPRHLSTPPHAYTASTTPYPIPHHPPTNLPTHTHCPSPAHPVWIYSYSLDLLVHCLHGFGHGVVFSAAAAVHPTTPPETYTGEPVKSLKNATDGHLRTMACSSMPAEAITIDDKVHKLAEVLCHGAPNDQLGYICAAGLYMTFFDGTPQMKEEGTTWMSPCDATQYSAPCFRFLFQTHIAGKNVWPLCVY